MYILLHRLDSAMIYVRMNGIPIDNGQHPNVALVCKLLTMTECLPIYRKDNQHKLHKFVGGVSKETTPKHTERHTEAWREAKGLRWHQHTR